MSVVILLADGARPDTLDGALQRGDLPALARLRDEGGLHVVTSCFPSVTGPAYTPFLMGRFPGPVGLPGLRWFDRARTACRFPDYTRSYVGYQMSAVDRDLDPDAPTIFELCDESLAALSVISRGLDKGRRIGAITARSAFRAATTHFRGNVAGWLDIDRDVADQIVDRVRTDRPAFTFAALTGVDKVSHARGHASPMVLDALRIVDDTAARIREDAERDGRWEKMSLWIVSDHGHSRVAHHEDLAALIEAAGMRTMSHPWVYNIAPEVAVMVSGNAMAHLYLEIPARSRPATRLGRFGALVEMLIARPSVDLLIMPVDGAATVQARDRGVARIWNDRAGYHYQRESGDPLGLGADVGSASMDAAYDATLESDYPDGIVQIVHLATAQRSGEIILSAARDWDFRARYEPIPHVSSHGALHREHMLVPLLLNQRVKREPRRTVDVMPSALTALGLPVPDGLDGVSFL
ncbi:MAG TPA: alkaline phosphatase family protein [Gemmatimonadaceae bacterium]